MKKDIYRVEPYDSDYIKYMEEFLMVSKINADYLNEALKDVEREIKERKEIIKKNQDDIYVLEGKKAALEQGVMNLKTKETEEKFNRQQLLVFLDGVSIELSRVAYVEDDDTVKQHILDMTLAALKTVRREHYD